MNTRARILVVDEHPFMRQGICSHLRQSQDLSVIGQAANGDEAIGQALKLGPDLIIISLELSRPDGLRTISQVRRILPWVKILALSARHGASIVARVREAGAQGYLAKDCSKQEFVRALELIQSGRRYFPPAFMAPSRVPLSDRPGDLTERETEILTLLGDGLSNKQVAEQLGISVRTVEKHRENILERLGMHNMADLVRFAVAEGLIKVTAPQPVQRTNGHSYAVPRHAKPLRARRSAAAVP